ncbi:transcriptional regulator MraZ [Silicimonas algicola]|uniref:Transcriptional regulator MraZ n=1 Tax=Silicimonas algicola TaxID=1826607 RepID=A0A316GDB4_9RHOB|nr:division/cell wall cluster transcriptional repressor MraZ [Silicimonas algicola]AZQ66370.1 transcriptional regulator MraZ [Silicimonas algicola]PWK58702.1 division/cell wall cluster transcriptional repressor MraZ [Silicimonas algicola]
MVRRFRGESVQKVDAKGRVSIPASFRRVLEDCDPNWSDGKAPELVIVYGDESRDYLECFTIDSANDVDEQIGRLPRGAPARKKLEKLFNGQSLPASVDETGRIVLPAKLRQKIGIDGEAYFIAMGDTFQIWKPETFEAQDAEVEEALEPLPPGADVWMLLDRAGPN